MGLNSISRARTCFHYTMTSLLFCNNFCSKAPTPIKIQLQKFKIFNQIIIITFTFNTLFNGYLKFSNRFSGETVTPFLFYQRWLTANVL